MKYVEVGGALIPLFNLGGGRVPPFLCNPIQTCFPLHPHTDLIQSTNFLSTREKDCAPLPPLLLLDRILPFHCGVCICVVKSLLFTNQFFCKNIVPHFEAAGHPSRWHALHTLLFHMHHP